MRWRVFTSAAGFLMVLLTMTVAMHGQEPSPFSDDVKNAWEKSGALMGWLGHDAQGTMSWRVGAGPGKAEEMPGFAGWTFAPKNWDPRQLALLPVPPLDFGLYLHGGKVNDEHLKALRRFKNLKALGLLGCEGVTNAGMKEVAPLEKLEALFLSGTKVTDAGMKELRGLKSLRTLNLWETQVTDEGLGHLSGMKLQSLMLPYRTRTDLTLKHYLAAVQPSAELKLHGWGVSEVGLKQLTEWPELQVLDLTASKIGDDGLKELTSLKHLKRLSLGNTKISDAGLKSLAGMKLTFLFIPEQARTDLGLKHYLSAMESPQGLQLTGWKITDEGLQALAGMKLQTLSIRNTKITDAGLKELTRLQGLDFLSIGGAKVTMQGLADLQKAFPKLKISP